MKQAAFLVNLIFHSNLQRNWVFLDFSNSDQILTAILDEV